MRQSPRAIRSSCVRLRRNDLLFILSYVTLHPTTLSLPSLVVSRTPCKASSSLPRKVFNLAINVLRRHARYCKNNTNLEQKIYTKACANWSYAGSCPPTWIDHGSVYCHLDNLESLVNLDLLAKQTLQESSK